MREREARYRGTRPSRRRARAAVAGLFAAAFAIATPAARAQTACEDVSGEWAIDLMLGPAAQEVTVTIEQTDCAISGLVVGDNETPFENGSVEASSFTFTTTVTNQANGQSIDITWLGTVEGDSVSGTLSAAPGAVGEFTGTRGG